MNDDYSKMIELVSYMQKNFGDKVHSTIGRCEVNIDNMELELGLKLPQSYKNMVNKFGTLIVMGDEFLGAPYNPKVTLLHREEDTFSDSLVVVYRVGDGSLFCIDTSIEIDGDNPVVFWDFGMENNERLGSKNFATFVIETIWKELLEDGYDVSEIQHLKPANPGWQNAVV